MNLNVPENPLDIFVEEEIINYVDVCRQHSWLKPVLLFPENLSVVLYKNTKLIADLRLVVVVIAADDYGAIILANSSYLRRSSSSEPSEPDASIKYFIDRDRRVYPTRGGLGELNPVVETKIIDMFGKGVSVQFVTTPWELEANAIKDKLRSFESQFEKILFKIDTVETEVERAFNTLSKVNENPKQLSQLKSGFLEWSSHSLTDPVQATTSEYKTSAYQDEFFQKISDKRYNNRSSFENTSPSDGSEGKPVHNVSDEDSNTINTKLLLCDNASKFFENYTNEDKLKMKTEEVQAIMDSYINNETALLFQPMLEKCLSLPNVFEETDVYELFKKGSERSHSSTTSITETNTGLSCSELSSFELNSTSTTTLIQNNFDLNTEHDDISLNTDTTEELLKIQAALKEIADFNNLLFSKLSELTDQLKNLKIDNQEYVGDIEDTKKETYVDKKMETKVQAELLLSRTPIKEEEFSLQPPQVNQAEKSIELLMILPLQVDTKEPDAVEVNFSEIRGLDGKEADLKQPSIKAKVPFKPTNYLSHLRPTNVQPKKASNKENIGDLQENIGVKMRTLTNMK